MSRKKWLSGEKKKHFEDRPRPRPQDPGDEGRDVL